MSNILIVEDDVLISEHLKIILKSQGHTVSKICSSLEATLTYLELETPDIALLDIRMNGIDEGIEVAKRLKQLYVPFVFVTSFSDKKTLMEAVIQKPAGYIVKPYTREDIISVLNIALKSIDVQYISLGNSQNIERIKVNDILWLKSENVYVDIQCLEKKHVFRTKLSEVQDLLPHTFIKTHQSFVVNLDKVESVSAGSIRIQGTEIPLSKKYRSDFLKLCYDQ